MNILRQPDPTRVAIVHEWLTLSSGSEEVLRQVLALFPQAAFFVLVDVMEPGARAAITSRPARTSFIQRLPFVCTRYRSYLPLMPLAVEQFDLSAYDVVISSSHAVAKGVITGPDQLHISYIHTPIRYAWDLTHAYLEESGATRGLRGILTRILLHYIRIWDVRTTNGVDVMIANSTFVARRIWKYYRRSATVIHPPVDVQFFSMQENKDDYYLCVSRMVPYKRVDLVVRAFNQMPDKRLIVAGGGPDLNKIRAMAGGNIQVLGFQTREALRDLMQHARAFIFPALEDFGLAPVEAQACGTPVIAYGKGGVIDTVVGLDKPKPTGLFFGGQSESSLRDAVLEFEKVRGDITPINCRINAEQFRIERFNTEFSSLVKKEWIAFQERMMGCTNTSGGQDD